MARSQSFLACRAAFLGLARGQKSTQVRLRARHLPCMFCPALVDMLHPAMSRRFRAWAIDNRDPSSPRPRSGYAQGVCFWLPRCECVVEMRKTYSPHSIHTSQA